MHPRQLRRVLLVEDHAPLRAAVASHFRRTGVEVLEAATTHGAIAFLTSAPDLILCDVCLPDGSAFDVFDASKHLSPEPLKIAISGAASAEEAFRLAQVGALAYLAKPFSLQDLADAVERVRREAPDLDSLVRASVGSVPLLDMQRQVRAAMVDQALALASESRSAAARLLDISRQAVQQFTRGSDREPASDPRDDAPDSETRRPPPPPTPR